MAEPRIDPWGLAVRPDRFEDHLAMLRRSRQPLPLSEFVERLARGRLPDNAIAVTFDDGYADNLREAKPRLAATEVPATVFVTTGAVGQRTEYWWDELARRILLRRAPLDGVANVAGKPCRLRLTATKLTAEDLTWRAWNPPRTDRQAAYISLWRRLRTAAADDRERAMQALRGLLDAPPPESGNLPMTQTEVADLAAGGLVEIGAHTVNHPVLPMLDAAERRREIQQGKEACERLIGRTIAGFAYPHGAMDPASRAAVEECGFEWACSTQPCAVPGSGYDRYALPRIAVADSSGRALELALRAAGA